MGTMRRVKLHLFFSSEANTKQKIEKKQGNVAALTCRLGGELVPVGGAHSQQPVAQVQVEALLSSHTTHHLQEGPAFRQVFARPQRLKVTSSMNAQRSGSGE